MNITFAQIGLPRYRSVPEFEERLCTRCREYWPADAEFFTVKDGSYHSWCRACCAEATMRARAKKAGRRMTVAAAAAIVFCTASISASAGVYCDSVARLAVAMQTAKEKGYSREFVAMNITQSHDDEARAVAGAMIHLVYDGNADNGLTPGRMGRLARAACLSTEPNAMNAGIAP